MAASLTLNKITAQRGISIGEAASRVADLGWTPSYVQEAMTFPTDYKISQGTARSDEASAALLLPDAGREGQPRLRRARCGVARRHVPQRGAALDRMDEAVPGDHPVPGNFSGALDGHGRPPDARRRAAYRLHDADGRRVPPLDDSDESEEVVHGELYRPGWVRYHGSRVRQVLRDHDRPSVRRRLPDRRRHHRGQVSI